MEKIQISEEQKQKLLCLFGRRRNQGMGLIIIGLIGIIPVVASFFMDSDANFRYSSTFVFSIIGIMFLNQGEDAKKKILEKDYQVYKKECKKVGWQYISVENNEILSKNLNKKIKKIEILDSRKLMQAGENVGIIQMGKVFWAFPLIA